MPVIKAVITTLDNLPLLKEQIKVLSTDRFISEIIVVNNGSEDGTKEWLHSLGSSTAHYGTGDPWMRGSPTRSGNPIHIIINRENKGAGPGRNAGLDAAGEFDYVLMLDGGIRPLRGGTEQMLDYLERRQDADVIGVEITDFETDYTKAWRRWTNPITDADTYRNTRLSHTAYCLARNRAFDGLRFREEGPFGQPGWGADDDEMCCQWNKADIAVHVVMNIHPYRRASGSFRRLYLETGIWPNQYGSVYEQRLVWLQQNWPQYAQGIQWDEPWLTVVVDARNGLDEAVKTIKEAHNELRRRAFASPWNTVPNPYSIVAWCPGTNDIFLRWAETCRLRQHHGNVAFIGDTILVRSELNESIWTGDFRLWKGANWENAVRTNSGYYGLVKDREELASLITIYNEIYPPQPDNIRNPPLERKRLEVEVKRSGENEP